MIVKITKKKKNSNSNSKSNSKSNSNSKSTKKQIIETHTQISKGSKKNINLTVSGLIGKFKRLFRRRGSATLNHKDVQVQSAITNKPTPEEIKTHMDAFMNKYKRVYNYSHLFKGTEHGIPDLVNIEGLQNKAKSKAEKANEEKYKTLMHTYFTNLFNKTISNGGNEIPRDKESIEEMIHNIMFDKLINPNFHSKDSDKFINNNNNISLNELLKKKVIMKLVENIKNDNSQKSRWKNSLSKHEILFEKLKTITFNEVDADNVDAYKQIDSLTVDHPTLKTILAEHLKYAKDLLIHSHLHKNKAFTLDDINEHLKQDDNVKYNKLPYMTKSEFKKFKILRDNSNKDNSIELSIFLKEMSERHDHFTNVVGYIHDANIYYNKSISNWYNHTDAQTTNYYDKYKHLLKLNLFPAVD